MTPDEELDALLQRASKQMLAELDKTTDLEAGLREVLRKAGVRPDLYGETTSPAGEVTDTERT